MEDRINNTEADMPYLRRIYAFAGVSAAAAHIYMRFKSPFMVTDISLINSITDNESEVPLIEGIAEILRCNRISAFGAGAIWILLGFRDLKKAGKLTASWWTILAIFVATAFVGGPGAAMAVMWAWREEILAKKRSR